MIHKYYDYRRPLGRAAAFLIIFLYPQLPLKKLSENSFTPFVHVKQHNNPPLLNENMVSLNMDARFIQIVKYIK